MSKYLDKNGITYLWNKLSLNDYPNNETLIAVLNAIDTTKADRDEIPTMDEIYNEMVARFTNADEVAY